MCADDELGRRITSAQDNLQAARRDGRFDDIVTWRMRVDQLLDELIETTTTSEGH